MEVLLENVLVYSLTAIICLGAIILYLRKQRNNSRIVEEKIAQAKQDGVFEPISLHPVVDVNQCIQTGACIAACPEKDILGILNGKATTINASHCVGHGACFHACPTHAITLCIGTEKRGVELPHVNQQFETSVQGIFIAGELGGMGLIKNAVEQGRQAVENIARSVRKPHPAGYDLIVVGAGPAGISASLMAKKLGLSCIVLEQDTLGGTVFTFPRAKIVMTSAMDLPLFGKVKLYETSKSELLDLWEGVISKHQIIVKENMKVESVVAGTDFFTLETGSGEKFTAHKVLLAIGRRGTPRKLGVPGEDLEKVAYRLLEPEHIKAKEIMVVGGGDSAIESALLLAQENHVLLSYRGESFGRLKPKNSEKINEASAAGAVDVRFNSVVTEITHDKVALAINGSDGGVTWMKNDLIYIFAGGELPAQFLLKAGIRITKKFGEAILKHSVILLLSAFLLTAAQNFAQISPGDLATAHAHLEGMSNCTKCHSLGEKISNDKCLACHTELKSRIDQNKGYHVSSEIKGKSCVTCHSDHHGRNFQLIRFSKEKFNHNLTGFKLTGAHALKQCTDCHKPSFISSPAIKKKRYTYLGLSQECTTCHTDYHQNTLKPGCTDCHDQNAFKPATLFSHKQTKFPLTGSHQHLSCTACHQVTTQNGKKFQHFSGLKYQSCANCHKDPHFGKFGPGCNDCHTTETFHAVKIAGNFDHSGTGFPLENKHRTVACKSCHKTNMTDPVKHGRCTDCHTDYHTGEFLSGGFTTDCSVCHTTRGFEGSLFTLEKHNTGPFPLKGAHLATPCFTCHKKTERWSFRNIGIRCIDCHENIHAGVMDAKYYPEGGCEKCHNNENWSSVRFDHSTTAFPLTPPHAKQSCRTCHFRQGPDGKVIQEFSNMSSNCTTCHTDSHHGQFEKDGITRCLLCHTSETWRINTFDHNKTAFKLDGQHVKVACSKCHPKITRDQQAFTLYKTNKLKCENCH